MTEGDQANPVGLGNLGAFLHRVVGVLVDHQQVASTHQTRQSPRFARLTEG